MRYYIAGPMSHIEHFNFPAFFEAARRLRERGYEVFNPAVKETAYGSNVPDPGKIPIAWGGESEMETPGSIRKRDFRDLLGCDAVVLLRGWEKSKGVLGELVVAQLSGMPIYELGMGFTLTPLSPRWHFNVDLVWLDRGYRDHGGGADL